jgi:DivIVA domain-containing protein
MCRAEWVILVAVEDGGFSKEATGEVVPPVASAPEQGSSEPRPDMPEDILNARFPVAVRGYERGAVDAYRKRVSRVVAELKMSASPQATVRHALDQAGQQVHGLLQSARETAEEITASARREAEESTARAKAEAAELVVHASAEADRVRAEANELIANTRAEADALAAKGKAEADEIRASARAEAENIIAGSRREADERRKQLEEGLALLRDEAETRMREIQANTEAAWEERRQLLDDIRSLAGGLGDLADAAGARLPHLQPDESAEDEPAEETLGDEAEDETKPSAAATEESARAQAAVGAPTIGSDVDDRIDSPALPPSG